ncbi:MAG: Lrp/AsnC family transcriptional regulator [Deltaproteobacteria bacterium]|nr:Lrp/AsnC family transcriptional regulator [Deltaproteobacteria bacterium]
MKMKNIDNIDYKILSILQKNARTSNAEIARQIGMAPSAVLERIRKLEQRKVILGYEARVNAKLLGHGLTAFTFVRNEDKVGGTETETMLAAFPEVVEVHYTAGQDSYLVKVRVADTEGLSKLLKTFGQIPTARDTRSTIVLSTVKETLGPTVVQPLNGEESNHDEN